MDWDKIRERELSFLHDEKRAILHKIARQRDGSNAHQQDGPGCSAELELELIDAIIATQQGSDALSLESLILTKLEHFREVAESLERWQRGQPTPPEYWIVECQRAFLTRLLSQYHAWRRQQAED